MDSVALRPSAIFAYGDEQGRRSLEALVEEDAGLPAISCGFPLVTRGDHETVEGGAFLYEALHASLQLEKP